MVQTPRRQVCTVCGGPWRGPGANMNVFAIESQVDAMASAAKQDPLAFACVI